MIHSLSGGVLDGDGYHTIVKVNVDYQGEKRVGYYICDEFRVVAGDKVIVETRDGFTSEGEVLKVDKNVSEKCSPVPIKRALKIIKKL